jgi:hypothetical protein
MKGLLGSINKISGDSKEFYLFSGSALFILCGLVSVMPVFFLSYTAISESISNWPKHLILAYGFIFIGITAASLWCFFQFWNDRKNLVKENSFENRHYASLALSYLLATMSRCLGFGLGIAGTGTLLVCGFVFSDREFFELLSAFGLHSLISLQIHQRTFIGLKIQAFFMIPVLSFVLMYFFKVMSEFLRIIYLISQQNSRF